MGCCGSSDHYELEIRVLRASGLPDVDLIGKIDPFVNVKYKGEDFKTDVIKGNDNPQWDNAIFRVEDAERGQADIIFNLSDWDRFTSNDFVGTAMISRNDQNIPYNAPQTFDLPLTLQGENRGVLTVSVEFIHEGENPKEFQVAQSIENSNATYGSSTTTTTTTTNNNVVNNTTVVQTTVIKKTVIVEEEVVKKKKPRKKVVNDDGVEQYEDEIENKDGDGADGGDAVDKYAEEEAGDEAAAEEAPAEEAPAEEAAVDMYGGAEPSDDKDKPDENGTKVLANNIYEFPIYKYNTENKWLESKKLRNIDMITIVTQCSIDRMPQLRAMCQSWSGIISVAVYIKNDVEACKDKLRDLFDEMERSYDVVLDISLLFENNERDQDTLYPINHLRNLALTNASTELVFLLDVDFVPSLDMHELLTSSTTYKSALNLAKKTSLGLVIPAFEINTTETDIIAHPRTKAEIYNMVSSNNASAFHVERFKYGHRATNYNYWFKTNEVYSIEYELMYEPYIIIKRDGLRKYDERYRGYGMNKIIHLAGLAMQDNTQFAVLPNVFVTASEHEKSVDYRKVYGRKNKNKLIKKQKKQRKQWLKKLWKISLCELMENDDQNTRLLGVNIEDNIRKDLVSGFSSNTMLMV